MIYLAADHRGFKFKEEIKKFLSERGYEAEDVGAHEYTPDDDYIDFARAASEKILVSPALHKGIFICGSGHGVDMVANKYKDIRAALCFNETVAVQSRQHEDANVLVLPADWLSIQEAKNIVNMWLITGFPGEERNVRRLAKMQEIEEKNFFARSESALGGK